MTLHAITCRVLSFIHARNFSLSDINQQLLDVYFLPHDIQRLEAYTRNQIEYRLILDLTTDICLLYFQGKLNDVPIDSLQKVNSNSIEFGVRQFNEFFFLV